MKAVVTIAIEDPSSWNCQQALKTVESFIGPLQSRLGNGTKAVMFSHFISDPAELSKHIGKIALLASTKVQQPYQKPKSWYSWIIEEAKNIYEGKT